METEFQNAAGKSMGEVIRDMADFLSTPYIIGKEHPVELCSFIEDLNMHGQFSFALWSEALAQGMSEREAEAFYLRACAPLLNDAIVNQTLEAFHDMNGSLYASLLHKYGNSFGALDGSYWATVLSVGIDADEVERVMHYLRLFTVVLMEFAYMEDRNPSHTYAWCYFESFRQALESFAHTEEEALMPLKIGAIGGSAGRRQEGAYPLSLGVDVINPNPHQMARGVHLDITLKDREGKVITVIKDRIESIDPDTTYHYGLSRKIRGAAVGSIAAAATVGRHLRLAAPVMGLITFSDAKITCDEGITTLCVTLKNGYDCPLRTLTVHYQLLSPTGRKLGGGSEWISDTLESGAEYRLCARIPLAIKLPATLQFSVDFDALVLVEEV